MMPLLLGKINADTKRLIIALLFVVIVFFIIVGSIALIVRKVMRKQAEGADSMLYYVVRAGIFNKKKDLIKFGHKKNCLVFFKQAWIPFLIMVAASVIILLYCLTMNNWDVNIFDYKSEGFLTLLHVFDWDNTPHTYVFGLKVVSDWPPLLNTPHWSWEAWVSYLFVPGMLVGIVWFLICVQAYIARFFRIRQVAKKVFDRKIDDQLVNDLPVPPVEQ